MAGFPLVNWLECTGELRHARHTNITIMQNDDAFDIADAYGSRASVATAYVTISNADPDKLYEVTLTFTKRKNSLTFTRRDAQGASDA